MVQSLGFAEHAQEGHDLFMKQVLFDFSFFRKRNLYKLVRLTELRWIETVVRFGVLAIVDRETWNSRIILFGGDYRQCCRGRISHS